MSIAALEGGKALLAWDPGVSGKVSSGPEAAAVAGGDRETVLDVLTSTTSHAVAVVL